MADATLRMLLLGEDRSASRALKGVGDSATKSGTHLKTFAKVAGLAFGAAAVGAARLAVDFAKAAIDDQKSTALLARQMKNSANARKSDIAQTENWITAQGKAYGVADDDLRPALGRLVAATHSVTRARQLAALAENVSAGTGKSLKQVTEALAKAQNGSLGGLSRLGVRTKDAEGKTRSLHDVTKDLAATYKGAASAAANTTAGRFQILSVQFSEMKENIGYRLLPVVTALGNFLLNNLVPAIGKTGTFLANNLGPVFDRVRGAVERMMPVLHTVGEFMAKNPAVVKTFVGVLGGLAVVIGVVTGAMAALDAVMAANPFVLAAVAIAGLAAGMVYAYKHSERFRSIVNALGHTFQWLAGVVGDVIGWIKGHWKLLGAILMGPVGPAVMFIVTHLSTIKDIIRDVSNVIRSVFSGAWRALRAVATGALNALRAPLQWIISKIEWILSKIPSIKLPHFPGLNSGNGPAPPPGRFGDQGFPDSSTTNTVGGSTLGRSGNTYVITVNGALDPLAVGQQIKQVVNTHDRMTGRTPTFA